MAAKPPSPMCVIAASLPPVTITSAWCDWISLNASPIAFEAQAQAVATAELGPAGPNGSKPARCRVHHQLRDGERADS